MKAKGEKQAFRDFYVEVDLKIVLSYPNQRDFRSSQPQHGRKRRPLVPGIPPGHLSGRRAVPPEVLANAIAVNRRELAQLFKKLHLET